MALSRNSRGLHRATPRELSLSINSRAHPTRTTRFRRPCQKRRCCTLLPLGRKSFLLSFPAPRERKPATGHSMRRVLPSLPSSRRDDRAGSSGQITQSRARQPARSLPHRLRRQSFFIVHSFSQPANASASDWSSWSRSTGESQRGKRGNDTARQRNLPFREFSGTSPVTHAKSAICIRLFRTSKLPNRSHPFAPLRTRTALSRRWPPS